MWNWAAKLEELREAGAPAALITVVRCTGSCPVAPGAKMIALAEGPSFGTIGGGHLEQLAIGDARKALGNGEPQMLRYPLGATAGQCCGGVVEVFIEPLNSGPRLYLFGAGHVGQALCKVLQQTPFIVHAIDERPDWMDAVPAEVRKHCGPWDVFAGDAVWSAERTYVAVMTHRHDLDEAIIADVVGRPTRYIGLIGSEVKWRRFRDRLEGRGLSAELLGRVRCPIGLDIGGKSPAEVAVSVAAELLSVHHGRSLGR
jgi:xanthine dehydrogenase accessory factor